MSLAANLKQRRKLRRKIRINDTHTQSSQTDFFSSLLAQSHVCCVPLDVIIHQRTGRLAWEANLKGHFTQNRRPCQQAENSLDPNQVNTNKSALLLHSSGQETFKFDSSRREKTRPLGENLRACVRSTTDVPLISLMTQKTG